MNKQKEAVLPKIVSLFGVCYWASKVGLGSSVYDFVRQVIKEKPKIHKDTKTVSNIRRLVTQDLGVKVSQVWFCSLVGTLISEKLGISAVVVYRRRLWCILGVKEHRKVVDVIVQSGDGVKTISEKVSCCLYKKWLSKKRIRGRK